MVIVI